MTDFAALLTPDRGQPARTLSPVVKAGFADWCKTQPPRARAAIEAARFRADPDSVVILLGDAPDEWNAAIGVEEMLSPWSLAAAATRLPEGSYRLAEGDPGPAALGWLLAQHRFDRYREPTESEGPRLLLTSQPARITEAVRLAEAVALVRDLVDTPASDMGPAELAAAADAVAKTHNASFAVTQGSALAEGYPMIHAVGRARRPRPRAAPDRARVGRCQAPAHRDCRQGRMF